MDGDVLVSDVHESEQDSFRRGGLLYLILAIIILILMGWVRTLGDGASTTRGLVAPTINSLPTEMPSGVVVFSGDAEPSSEVELVINGTAVNTVNASTSGQWIYPAELEAGSYDIVANGLDADGNMALSSETLSFDVFQRFDMPSLNLPDGDIDPSSFVLSGIGTPGSTVEIFNNGVSLGTAVVGDDGTWSFDADLNGYRNSFTITGFEPDGTEIGSTDAVELLVPLASAPLVIDAPALGEFSFGGNALPVGTIDLSGTGEPNSFVDLSFGDIALGGVPTDADGNWSLSADLETAAGEYALNGTMYDGEDQAVLLNTAVIDGLVVPVVGAVAIDSADADDAGRLVLMGTAVPGQEINIWLNGEVVDTVTADDDGSWSWQAPSAFTAGEYDLQAQLAASPDIVSDVQSVTLRPFVSVTTPEVTLLDDTTGDVVISGQTLPNNRVELFIDGQYFGETVADADGNWTFTANLNSGAYTIAARAVDNSGSRRAEAAIRAVVGESLGGLELVYAGTGEAESESATVTAVSLSGVPAVEIILDASWSMVEPIDNTTRFAIAKEALANIAGEILPEGTPTALRIFGNIEGDLACRTDLMVPYGPLDRDAFNAVVDEAEPQFNANTAIGASLLAVLDDLADATEEERIVVLLTDGQETCDGDPAGAIQQLVDAGFNVQVNIVGLAIAEQTLKDEFTRWATIGGGQYYDVANPGQLVDAMRVATGAFYTVRDEDGVTVATSRIGGPALDLAPGTYSVEIRTSPATTIEEVVITEGEVLQIILR